MALTQIKTGGLANNSVTDAKVADAITVTGAQTGITQVGTLTAGTWNGTAIASAYLDADTAHLSGSTFTGNLIVDKSISAGDLNTAPIVTFKNSYGSGHYTAIKFEGADGSGANTGFLGYMSHNTASTRKFVFSHDGITRDVAFNGDGSATFNKSMTINESGGDNDFRVETSGNTHGFHIDAGNNVVNINAPLSSQTQSTPQEVLALKTFYTGSADGAAGAGSLLSFYIPDDETNPAKGGGVACVKESADDSDMSSSLTFYTSGNDESISEKVRINSSGYVGIGGDPSVALHIKGHDPHFRIEDTTGTTEYWNISVGQAQDGRLEIDDSDNDNGVYMNQNDTSWTSGSDERLKTNWTAFDDALGSINSLTKVGTFQYTKSIEDQTPKNDAVHSGLSAQEVQKFLPNSVSENSDGILGLQYQHLIPVLVKAVQELSAKVEALENA